jgi:hypothetical protein
VSDRTETAIAALASASAVLVMAAPILGRAGHAHLADAAMGAAALAGLGAFCVAAVHTFRAARGRGAGGDAGGAHE